MRRPVLCSILVIIGTGCATIATGTSDIVRISSSPPGALVEISGRVSTTLGEVGLSRSLLGKREGYARLAGYRERRFEIPHEFNMWTLGNVLTFGLGIPVDVLSGAVMRRPAEYEFVLIPMDQEE